ncbi:MAG: glutaredoxin family protein [Chromatiales bacterium]|nr:glutaredoxin family protein [Chromatiales bacterium]
MVLISHAFLIVRDLDRSMARRRNRRSAWSADAREIKKLSRSDPVGAPPLAPRLSHRPRPRTLHGIAAPPAAGSDGETGLRMRNREAELTRTLIFSVAVVLWASCAAPSAAEIHKWTDALGRVHFGDRPPRDVNAEVVTVRPNVYESPSSERLSSDFGNDASVVLYSTTWCVHCKRAREYFAEKGIPFEEYDVETTDKGRRDYARLRARGVPVILVGGQRLNGFSAAAFERLRARGRAER